jgi:hypothetical protein
MSMRRAASLLLVCALLASACKRSGPELTCKANGVCFVCPDEKAQTKCQRDPSTARCKYAEPSHCTGK